LSCIRLQGGYFELCSTDKSQCIWAYRVRWSEVGSWNGYNRRAFGSSLFTKVLDPTYRPKQKFSIVRGVVYDGQAQCDGSSNAQIAGHS
jgi:hypothetical protein